MKTESGADFLKRAVTPLLFLGILFLPIFGIYVYLGSGKPVSVGHFQLERRNDWQWNYQRTSVVAIEVSGPTRAGDVFCLGPFCAIHWRDLQK